MFTTGSKLLIGAAVITALCAVGYGTTQDGVMGTIGLVSAAAALALLAGVDIYIRDANISAADEASVATCPAAQPRAGRSIWPLVLAFSGVVMAVGLISYQAVFTIGVLLFAAAGLEWTLHAWAERASDDPSVNSEVRTRLAGPLEFPLAGAVMAGIVVYAFSRIMLWLSKTNTVIAFSILGSILLAIAFAFAYRPTVRKGAVAGLAAFGAVAIVAGGAAAGVDGEREIEVHETTGGLVAEGESICESPEEFEADEKASQTVSNSANVAATITLTDDERLEFDVPGPIDAGNAVLQLPRSNPNNIIFRNSSDEDRRLSLDGGTIMVESESGQEEEIANQACTTLVEPGGEQLLTLRFDIPSAGIDDGYRFFVPGVDSAELEVVVP